MYEFANVMIRARIETHLSLRELAAKIGIFNGTIGFWTKGSTLPTPKVFRKTYEVLQKEGCSIETLNDLENAYNDEKTERTINRANRNISSEETPKWDGKAHKF